MLMDWIGAVFEGGLVYGGRTIVAILLVLIGNLRHCGESGHPIKRWIKGSVRETAVFHLVDEAMIILFVETDVNMWRAFAVHFKVLFRLIVTHLQFERCNLIWFNRVSHSNYFAIGKLNLRGYDSPQLEHAKNIRHNLIHYNSRYVSAGFA